SATTAPLPAERLYLKAGFLLQPVDRDRAFRRGCDIERALGVERLQRIGIELVEEGEHRGVDDGQRELGRDGPSLRISRLNRVSDRLTRPVMGSVLRQMDGHPPWVELDVKIRHAEAPVGRRAVLAAAVERDRHEDIWQIGERYWHVDRRAGVKSLDAIAPNV